MGKFGAIRSVRQEHAQDQEASLPSLLAAPPPLRLRGRPAGKRSNPEFEPTTIFLRKVTKKTVNRMLEDAGTRQDFSELVEKLLQAWVASQV